MIIDAIRLYSAAESSKVAEFYAEFSLDRADTSQSYILQQAWGLDLDEITPNLFGSYGDFDFVNMIPKDRLLVFKIKLQPQFAASETPSSLRDHLYRIIGGTRTAMVEVRLRNLSANVARIRGRVKKFEADLFAPEPVIQISIECKDPFFRGMDQISPEVTITDCEFTDDLSTAPHGVELGIIFNENVPSPFIIQGVYGTEEAPFRINYAFETDDILVIDNQETSKLFYVLRDGDPIPLMDKLATGQIWPTVYPGNNHFEFPADDIALFYLLYYPVYWGV